MCLVPKPKIPDAPKPVQNIEAEPIVPELGGTDDSGRKRKAKSLGIRSLRTDVGGVRSKGLATPSGTNIRK